MLLLGMFLSLTACAVGEISHCATVGTHDATGAPVNDVQATNTVDSFTGIYHAAPFCPPTCFSACRYGCLSCKVR